MRRTVEHRASDPVIETSTSTYHVRSDGIVVQTITHATKQTRDDALENIAAFIELSRARPTLFLLDMQTNFTVERGVRDIYAAPEHTSNIVAMAMVTRSATTRVIGNFFMQINRPPYPCKMFPRVLDAVAWLYRYR